jgi:hypothetical protein
MPSGGVHPITGLQAQDKKLKDWAQLLSGCRDEPGMTN